MTSGPWDFGWDALVALGTLGLAGVTAALALSTRSMARKTSDLAAASVDEAKAGMRPVLIGRNAGLACDLVPDPDGAATLRIGVVNAGRGPALNAYALGVVATSQATKHRPLTGVGNVAPDGNVTVSIDGVIWADDGRDRDAPYWAAQVVLAYRDLAERPYYSIIRLVDPKDGRRQPTRPGMSHPVALRQEGSEVGEGEAPPPQWYVTFFGTLTDDQRERLRGSAMLLLGGHRVGVGDPSSTGGRPSRLVERAHVCARP